MRRGAELPDLSIKIKNSLVAGRRSSERKLHHVGEDIPSEDIFPMVNWVKEELELCNHESVLQNVHPIAT